MISDLNIQINPDRCVACGTCVDRCIMDNLRLHVPPCRTDCPLKMNCQGYLRLLARGEGPRAAEELRKYTPFGAILGRVCHHPCESVCERLKKGDDAVNIRAVKRYLADSYPEITRSLPVPTKESGKHVAVVGSGPAGLMAAYDLRVSGHAVTVHEAAAEPGGLLRWAIPSFRLPVGEVRAAVSMLGQMGITFKTSVALGREIDIEEMQKRFDAVLLAIGAGTPARLGIPGEDLTGVLQGMDFLRDIKGGKTVSPGLSVVVIGGGNAAVDTALTCAGLGIPEIKVVCVERRDEMPAFKMEIDEAIEQGILIENCWGPRRFIQTDEGKIRMEMSRCTGLYDEKGAFCPVLDDAGSLNLDADSVIVAIGQRRGHVSALGLDAGHLSVDPVTLASTAFPAVFCCGDAVTGPGSVVEAMGQGRTAAVSIDRFLTAEGLDWGRNAWVENGWLPFVEPDSSRASDACRREYDRLPVKERTLSLEVECGFSTEAAMVEAQRCFGCGRAAEFNETCWFCLPCEIECPEEAITVRIPYLLR